ncbi:MAG: hypothetical protein ACYTHM_23975, partial [Planctomycetota bacterium]
MNRLILPGVHLLLSAMLLVTVSSETLGQTNLALSATASDSGGGQVQFNYGSANMNDGNANTYQWILTSGNPDPNAFAQLTWSTAQTISSITMILRVYSSGRLLDSASIQYLSGSTWITDQTYPSQNGAITYTINLLQPRTTTAIRLTNMVTVGTQPSNPWIAEFQAWGPQGPPAPAWITVPATSVGGNYQITWAAVTGATSYELEEDTSATFTNPTQIYSGANTSHNITNQAPGTYYYRVRARDAVGPSGWTVGTNPCVVTVPPPTPPGSITVPQTSSTGSFTVSWTVSTGATSYDLQEANNPGFNGATLVYQGANLNYNVTGKTGGTWYYRVRGVNAGGNSTWTVGANGCQIIPPNPPATITVPQTSASGNYTVNWATSQGATGYDLQEDISASFTAPTTVYTGA